jgi:hypothetical protein
LNVATSFDEEEVAFPEPDGDEIEGGDEVGDEGYTLKKGRLVLDY